MVEPKQTLRDQLASLRASYAAQLCNKIDQVEESWQQLCRRRDGAALAELHQLVHSLAGSGGTFGFNELGIVAQQIEYRLQALRTQELSLDTLQQHGLPAQIESLRSAIEPSDGLASNPLDGASLARTSSDSRLIFLLADDPELAEGLAVQIGHFGYTVKACRHPAELEAAVARITPAAVVVDALLATNDIPVARSIAAIQEQRERPIPVLFISAHGDLVTRLSAVRAGGQAYLTKPIDVGSLVDQLDVLTKSRVSEPYRILVVEDSRQLARYYTVILEQAGMVTTTVTDPLQVMLPLTEFRPDLILMDVFMPGCSGLELAQVIRQQETFLSIPIVFLSAETDPTRQLAAMSLGGDDFLTKPIKPDHLVTAVRSRAERSRALRSFMLSDSLTGLLNHTATKEQLDRELARAVRAGSALTLAVIDIDHFKQVNDTYGHPTGDQVIKSLSRLLRQRLRTSDIVGRYGGEEFGVILPDTDGPTAVRVLDAIRDGFGRVEQRAQHTVFNVNFSCGVASFPQYSDGTSLIDAADKMLYQAKAMGRNRVLLAAMETYNVAFIAQPAQPRTDEPPEPSVVRHVLVVEDNADINRLLQSWLTARGFTVEAAFDGQQALARLACTVPDLMVLDVLMPDMSGLELLDYVRSHGLDTAVIVTTAHGSDEIALDALERGADAYLRKPFQTREFQNALDHTLAGLERRRVTGIESRLGH